MRNLLAQVRSEAQFHEVKAALKAAWEAETAEAARQQIATLVARLRPAQARLATWLEETFEETLAYFELSDAQARLRLRSTNGLEHDHAEVRRRTRVVRIFPNEASLLRLTTALAVERCDQWAERRYLMLGERAKLDQAWKRIRRCA